MFSAIADQLHVNGVDTYLRSAMDVRQELMKFVRADSSLCSRIEATLEWTDTLDKYLDRMTMDGTWGDGNMLSAASLCYRQRIAILKPDDSQPIIIDNPTVSSEDNLYLGYVSSSLAGQENHYVSLRRGVPKEDNDIQQETSKPTSK